MGQARCTALVLPVHIANWQLQEDVIKMDMLVMHDAIMAGKEVEKTEEKGLDKHSEVHGPQLLFSNPTYTGHRRKYCVVSVVELHGLR